MHVAQKPQRNIQEPCADYVHPRGRTAAQMSFVPFEIEQIAAETVAGWRVVHMQQRVVSHL